MDNKNTSELLNARKTVGGIALVAAAFSGSSDVTFALLFLLLIVNLVIMLLAARAKNQQKSMVIDVRKGLDGESLLRLVDSVMNVENTSVANGLTVFQGKFKTDSADACKVLQKALANRGIPILQHAGEQDRLTIVPGKMEDYIPPYRTRPWLHVLLGVLTIFSTTAAGARNSGHESLDSLSAIAAGLSYSLPLMAILGIHELGHYTLGRIHGMLVSPPFFIPVPFGLGTLGAFIQLRSPAQDRKALFDMAVAGPLCGLAAAIVALMIGLQDSVILHPPTPQIFSETKPWEGMAVSSSMLLSFIAQLVRGDSIRFGDIIHFSPMALAGWIGFWVTAINLLPVGQLDGGHVFQSMFGSSACEKLTRAALLLLLCLTVLVSPAFLVWLIVFYLISGPIVPPLNDSTGLPPYRFLLACCSLSLVVLILLPVPQAWTMLPH